MIKKDNFTFSPQELETFLQMSPTSLCDEYDSFQQRYLSTIFITMAGTLYSSYQILVQGKNLLDITPFCITFCTAVFYLCNSHPKEIQSRVACKVAALLRLRPKLYQQYIDISLSQP